MYTLPHTHTERERERERESNIGLNLIRGKIRITSEEINAKITEKVFKTNKQTN